MQIERAEMFGSLWTPKKMDGGDAMMHPIENVL